MRRNVPAWSAPAARLAAVTRVSGVAGAGACADTVNVGVQFLLPSLTSIVGGYDYQWREGGVRMGRINVGLVQAF